MPHGRRATELQALTAIAAQVNCTQDLDEILAGALETTLDVVGVDAGEVFLIDEDTGELLLHAQKGLSDAFVAEEMVIGAGECLCGLASASERAVVAADIAAHPAQSRPACLGEGFRSLLCLPLRARGDVLGLLNVQSRSPRQFTPDDEELLTAIGNQIGIAIANARLIDDAEQRRATLDSVMRSMVDGLVLFDRRGRITYANPFAQEVLGLSARELQGRTIAMLEESLGNRLAPPARSSGLLSDALQDPQDTHGAEFTLTAPTPRAVQARFFAIHDAAGAELGLGMLLRDITREKELDEMKSQLLSTVSHELRTPLASIKGFATTLLREDVQWDEGSRREFLSIIDEESDRLTELIGNLLDMSRIEAGTLRVEPEPVDVASILRETAAEFQIVTHLHRLRVILPPVLPLVLADPRRTRQVLRNLVENAVKYSPSGGPINITAEVQTESVQVSVEDQGIGIDPEHLDRVFQRFYQVDSASTRKVGGSGLGLSICKAIIEAQDGQIWASSQQGEGSTFHFTLPLALSARAS